MQQFYLNPPVQPEENQSDALVVELFLDSILLNKKKEKLLLEIDEALMARDKDLFLRLSQELKEFNQ